MRNNGHTSVVLIGTPAEVEVTRYTLLYLLDTLNRMADQQLPLLKVMYPHIHGKPLRRSYLEGASSRVMKTILEMVKDTLAQEKEKCSALVVRKERDVKRYLRDHYGPPDRSKINYTSTTHRGAHNQGWNDGASIAVRPGIKGSSTQAIGV